MGQEGEIDRVGLGYGKEGGIGAWGRREWGWGMGREGGIGVWVERAGMGYG